MPATAQTAPDRLYAASTAMNVVLVEEADDLTGVETGRQTPHRQLGERFRELLHDVEEVG